MGHAAVPVQSPAPVPATPRLGQPGRAWTMRLADEPGALMRVLTLLRRRRCEILDVDFHAGDRHRPARLRVRVRPSGGRADSLEPWLKGLIDVLEVTPER